MGTRSERVAGKGLPASAQVAGALSAVERSAPWGSPPWFSAFRRPLCAECGRRMWVTGRTHQGGTLVQQSQSPPQPDTSGNSLRDTPMASRETL